jgi:hypothetical protein
MERGKKWFCSTKKKGERNGCMPPYSSATHLGHLRLCSSSELEYSSVLWPSLHSSTPSARSRQDRRFLGGGTDYGGGSARRPVRVWMMMDAQCMDHLDWVRSRKAANRALNCEYPFFVLLFYYLECKVLTSVHDIICCQIHMIFIVHVYALG